MLGTAPPDGFKKIGPAMNRWTPNWSQLTSIFRQMTNTVNSSWNDLPPAAQAWSQLFAYHPNDAMPRDPINLLRRVVVAFHVARAMGRNDLEFFEYVENVQAFRRAVMDAVERHDSEFQAALASAMNEAFKEIEAGTAETIGSSEAEIREWFNRHDARTDEVQHVIR